MPDFNKEQKMAIDARNCNVLVSASAGSGKTAVLVERIVNRIIDKDDPCNIDDFLVVTFTKAAAKQMKEKLTAKLEAYASEHPSDSHAIKQLSLINKADVTTIDSFCLKIVKENFYMLGIDSNFSLMDEKLMDLMKDDILDELFDEEYKKSLEEEDSIFSELIQIFGEINDDSDLKRVILNCVREASSVPDVNVWYDEARAAVSIFGQDELENSSWIKKYMGHIKNIAYSCMAAIEEGEEIANDPFGCGNCADIAAADKDMVENILSADNYYELLDAVRVDIPSLKPVRKDGPEKDNYLEFKNIRYTYIDTLKALKNNLPDPTGIYAATELLYRIANAVIDLCIKYTERLDAEKKRKRQYEFSDIAHMALQIVTEGHDKNGRAIPSAVGKVISERYKEIYIDEYQDSNFIQEDILTSVSRMHKNENNMFMVGDVKQSIYKFRQARPELFTDKFYTYSQSEEGSERLILLKNNYRSRAVVLDAVNDIFEFIMKSDLGGINYDSNAALLAGRKFLEISEDKNYSKNVTLLLASERSKEEKEHYSISDDDESSKLQYEARLIAEKIIEYTDPENGLYIIDDETGEYRIADYKDCVVLLRSLKNRGDVIAKELEKFGIPVVVDNPNGYFDALEVTTMLSMLKVIDNSRQDIPLAAVLLSPLAGIDPSMMVLISATSGTGEKKLDLYDKCQLFALTFEDSEDEYRRDIAERLNVFLERIESWKKIRPYMSISGLINLILKETGYMIYVSALTEGKKRVGNLEMLMEKADIYEQGEFKGLFNFLRYMEKIRIHDIDFGETSLVSESDNVVRITTMHKSKGLEYPIVFASALGQDFNTQYTKNIFTVSSDYHFSMKYVDVKRRIKSKSFMQTTIHELMKLDNLAEEQRILYVAMTRAKEKLVMTGYVKDIDSIYNNGRVDYITRTSAKNYLDWIIPVVYGLSGSKNFTTEIKYLDEITAGTIRMAAKAKERYNDLKKNLLAADTMFLERIKNEYSFSYEYSTAARKRGKASISDFKKMDMYVSDEEKQDVSENSIKKRMDERGTKGATRGTVFHKIMELLPFKAIDSKETFKYTVDEIYKMDIFDEYRDDVFGFESIYRFYDSELFDRMKKADEKGELFREQRFTAAYDIKRLYKNQENIDDNTYLPEDKIILQGEIDAYFIENDKVILLDYKTDGVKSEQELIDHYYTQLDLYAEATERLTGLPVSEWLIYSFKFNSIIETKGKDPHIEN